MSETDCSQKEEKDHEVYRKSRSTVKNKCLTCEKFFNVVVYDINDSRFIRYCNSCRTSHRKTGAEIDLTHTIGH